MSRLSLQQIILLVPTLSALFLSCAQEALVPVVDPKLSSMSIEDLSAHFNSTSNRVELAWTKPVGSPDFYEVYWASDKGSRPQFKARTPVGVQNYDVAIGLDNDTIYYTLVPVAIIGYRDTVRGASSNIAECVVGGGLSLVINDNDDNLIRPDCILALRDPLRQVSKIEITDSIQSYSDRDSVFFTGTSDRNPSYLRNLAQDSTVYHFLWNLRLGAGIKKVAARVTLKGSDGSDSLDTLIDDIRIAPYSIAAKLRNETDPFKKRTMIVNPFSRGQITNQSQYFIFGSQIDFTVSIGNDSTFDPHFEVWLVFPDSGNSASILLPKTGLDTLSSPWIETGVMQDSLTGIGSFHDDMGKIYQYSFGNDNSGRAHIQNMRWTRLRPSSSNDVDLKTLSTAGSFWGKHDSVVTIADPSAVISYLQRTSPSIRSNQGYKEIALVIRMKGRFFNDIRTYISAPLINNKSAIQINYSFAPPLIIRSHFDFTWLADGTSISNSFTINTNIAMKAQTSTEPDIGIVKSPGGARITQVELLVAEMPDSLKRVWIGDVTPSTLTYEYLLSKKHRIIPCAIPLGVRSFAGFSLKDVDVSDWPRGYYLFAFITEDEFGVKGIAPTSVAGGTAWTHNAINPFHWYISSSQ